MLRRATIIALSFLLLLTGTAFYTIFSGSNSSYEQQQQKVPKEATLYPVRQTRSGVQKDLWMADEKTRLHHQMVSPRSVLTAFPKGNNFELVEEMQGMKCYLQENVEKDGRVMQQIRFIESESGTYHFSSQHFTAHEVFLALFRLPGSALETRLDFSEAFLKGVAQEVSLSFADNSPDFHAKKFKAQIRPQ